MGPQFDPGGSLRLSLPDGVIDITPQTTPEQRRQILDDLRSRYPDMLEQAPELEGMILGTDRPSFDQPPLDRPPFELMVEDISTPERQRKAVEDMQKAMPELMQQDPRIERALMGDQQAMDELIAEGGSFSAPESIRPQTTDTSAPAPAAAAELTGPVSEHKGFLARLFGR